MIERVGRRRIVGQALFVLLFLVLLFVRLLPLSPGRIIWPGPDLALCLTLAWVLRRPDLAPALIIAALFLLEDIMLMRPLGLWAAIVVMGTEAARQREHRWRELPFMVEWLRVATLIGMMMLADRFALSLFLLPKPPLGQVIMQCIATAGVYPLVAGFLHWPMGLRRGTLEPDTRHR